MAAIDFIIQSAAIIEGVERDHVFRRIRALKPQTDTIAALKKNYLAHRQKKQGGRSTLQLLKIGRLSIIFLPEGG